jgi:hypothetical protein
MGALRRVSAAQAEDRQVPSGARSAIPLATGRFRDVDDLSLTMSRITTDDPDLLGRGDRQHLPPKGEMSGT